MSERNWGIIAAAGLGVVSFSAVGGFMLATQAYDQHQEREGTSYTARDSERRPQQADTDHAGVPPFAERFISNPEPGDGTEREKRDLAAQENTAAWAFWIVVISAAQALLSFIGILFIARSLKQGEASLSHAREVSYTELRAYVGFTPGTLEDSPYEWRFKVDLRNLGQTPAFKTKISYLAYYLPFPVASSKPDLPAKLYPLDHEDIAPNDFRSIWTGGIRKTPERESMISLYRACIVTRLVVAYETHGGERIEEPPLYGLFFARTEKELIYLNETHAEGGYWAKIIEDTWRQVREQAARRKEQEDPKHPEAP